MCELWWKSIQPNGSTSHASKKRRFYVRCLRRYLIHPFRCVSAIDISKWFQIFPLLKQSTGTSPSTKSVGERSCPVIEYSKLDGIGEFSCSTFKSELWWAFRHSNFPRFFNKQVSNRGNLRETWNELSPIWIPREQCVFSYCYFIGCCLAPAKHWGPTFGFKKCSSDRAVLWSDYKLDVVRSGCYPS